VAEPKIIWSPEALDHLDQIARYIAEDSIRYATIVVSKITAIVESIPSFPKVGRMVPEYHDERIRERIYDNYRIVYRLKNSHIEIVAICHGTKLFGRLI